MIWDRKSDGMRSSRNGRAKKRRASSSLLLPSTRSSKRPRLHEANLGSDASRACRMLTPQIRAATIHARSISNTHPMGDSRSAPSVQGGVEVDKRERTTQHKHLPLIP